MPIRTPSPMSMYTPDNLFPALKIFVEARREALEAGFSDNGGAIHSIERIVDILGCRIRYPGLSHINNYRTLPTAERSEGAAHVLDNNQPVRIEHVAPLREFARKVCDMVQDGATDDALIKYIKDTYRLVLLTPDEARRLDQVNRSQIVPDRLRAANIRIVTGDT